MGGDWLIKEEQRKQNAMEAMPERLDDAMIQIDELRDELEKGNTTIVELKHELSVVNSFKSKIKDYFIGGFVGAAIGILLSALFL